MEGCMMDNDGSPARFDRRMVSIPFVGWNTVELNGYYGNNDAGT
jgi:hypothetical protein